MPIRVSSVTRAAQVLVLASQVHVTTAQTWVKLEQLEGPAHEPSLVYDDARERVVLYGVGVAAQTWEWNGTVWTLRDTRVHPRAVTRVGMAFDSARRRVVLFGGVDGAQTSSLAETWEWDGEQWMQRTLALAPSPRTDPALVYDTARRRAVLFGGWPMSSPYAADTWEYDGAAWVQRFPPTPLPAARRAAVAAYDEARQRTVLFGGLGNGYLDDTWEWNGTAWTERQPATRPPARSGHKMVYDAVARRVVMHGGGAPIPMSDVWEWDGTNWTRRMTTSPTPGANCGIAFDRRHGALVRFGATVPHTLLLRGTTWTLGPATAVQPPARSGHSLNVMPGTDRIVLFGGSHAFGGRSSDTWEWDGSQWLAINTGGAPSDRWLHACAYDVASRRLVLFGGEDPSALADTWEYDGSSWVRAHTGAGGPPARWGHSLAADRARGRVVLFGGSNHVSLFGDTWEWNGGTWTQRSAVGPSPRLNTALAFDTVRQRTVLFGGTDASGPLGDTWEWDGASWTLRATSGPAARAEHVLVFAPELDRVVVLGGASTSVQDSWAWDGATWTALGALPESNWRGAFAAVDPVRGGILTWSGSSVANMWRLTRTPGVAASYGVACAGAAGAPRLVAAARPWLGQRNQVLDLDDLQASAAAAVVFAAVPATLSLGGGCSLYVSPSSVAASTVLVANRFGSASTAVPIPTSNTLVGASMYLQGFALDSQGPVLGGTWTNGVRLTLGL